MKIEETENLSHYYDSENMPRAMKSVKRFSWWHALFFSIVVGSWCAISLKMYFFFYAFFAVVLIWRKIGWLFVKD